MRVTGTRRRRNRETRSDRPCPHDTCDGSGITYNEAANSGALCRCKREELERRRISAAFMDSGLRARFDAASIERNPLAALPAPALRDLLAYLDPLDAHMERAGALAARSGG